MLVPPLWPGVSLPLHVSRLPLPSLFTPAAQTTILFAHCCESQTNSTLSPQPFSEVILSKIILHQEPITWLQSKPRLDHSQSLLICYLKVMKDRGKNDVIMKIAGYAGKEAKNFELPLMQCVVSTSACLICILVGETTYQSLNLWRWGGRFKATEMIVRNFERKL